MNAYQDERAWREWLLDRQLTRQEARERLAPLKVKPPTPAQLKAMHKRARLAR